MFESMKRGMANTRQRFTEYMNELLDRGPAVDEDFWDGLEEALILADVGAPAAADIVERIRTYATRKALPDAYAVMDALADQIAETFTPAERNLFDESPVLVLFVGINGAGKTTTVGKIAYEQKAAGRGVLLGSADTFRAAAIEQLEEWGRRAGVEIVERERGSDPASVCYDTIERAEQTDADLVLIDTAGRLHTSDDLMRELQKVVNVVRKRANMPVKTVLVIDATTGQNGLSQARKFNDALQLDGLIVTKLDGTAKGGIALAVSHELGLPIAKVGVGESLQDLQDFDARDFAAALIGAEPVDVPIEEEPAAAAEASASSFGTPRSAVQEIPAESPSCAPLLHANTDGEAELPREEGSVQRVPTDKAEASAASAASSTSPSSQVDPAPSEDDLPSMSAPFAEPLPEAPAAADFVSAGEEHLVDANAPATDTGSAESGGTIAHANTSSEAQPRVEFAQGANSQSTLISASEAHEEERPVGVPTNSESEVPQDSAEPASLVDSQQEEQPQQPEKQNAFKRFWKWLGE